MYSSGVRDEDFEACWQSSDPEIDIALLLAELRFEARKASRPNTEFIERVYSDPKLDLLRCHNSPYLLVAEIGFVGQNIGFRVIPVPKANYSVVRPGLERLKPAAIRKLNYHGIGEDERFIASGPGYHEPTRIDFCEFLPHVLLERDGREIFVGELATFVDEAGFPTENLEQGLFVASSDKGHDAVFVQRSCIDYVSLIDGTKKDFPFSRSIEDLMRAP